MTRPPVTSLLVLRAAESGSGGKLRSDPFVMLCPTASLWPHRCLPHQRRVPVLVPRDGPERPPVVTGTGKPGSVALLTRPVAVTLLVRMRGWSMFVTVILSPPPRGRRRGSHCSLSSSPRLVALCPQSMLGLSCPPGLKDFPRGLRLAL